MTLHFKKLIKIYKDILYSSVIVFQFDIEFRSYQ